jgi:hypothetical protein
MGEAREGIMLEILRNFESILGEAARVRPILVIGPGAAAVVVGLFVWLGGLGLRKVLVAIAGAVCGGVLGFLVIRHGLVAAGVSAAVVAATAVVFERVSIALLAGALAALISFIILAGPPFERSQTAGPIGPDEASPAKSGQILELLKAYATDVGERVKRLASQMPIYKRMIMAAWATVFMAGAFIFRRLVPALCFSVIGTTFVFAGMILLLLYKQAAPVSRISGQPLAYAGAFAAMTVFGTAEQVLLCRGAKMRAGKKKKAALQDEGVEKRQRRWRTT